MRKKIKKAAKGMAFDGFRPSGRLSSEISFTLMELITVLVIVGILATIGVSQYFPLRESAFDREAEANLRLIAAGERIWRLEDANSLYRACANTAAVNTDLRLSLPRTSPAWNYQVFSLVGGTDFCAQATRTTGTGRRWRICAPRVGTPDPLTQNFPCALGCP